MWHLILLKINIIETFVVYQNWLRPVFTQKTCKIFQIDKFSKNQKKAIRAIIGENYLLAQAMEVINHKSMKAFPL